MRTEDVERVGRTATISQWCVAAVVMAGSAASAGIGFAALHEHWGVGVVTGLGVDCALASSLVMGRRLRNLGIATAWGTILQWLTAGMTLCLNSGAAAVTGNYALAVAHAFLPVLLVVLCEAGAEAQIKLHHLARQAAAREQAERDMQLATDRARDEADRQHREQVRQDQLRAAELEREDRRNARDHAQRQAAACMALAANLGAVLSRPRPRPRRVSQPQPRRTQAVVPTRKQVPVEITDDLVVKARQLRVLRDSRGESTGRAVLQKEFGLTERAARELARRLDERALQAVVGR